ncbi:MAG: hypothetical protein RLZZ196_3750 [Bacteroidota bacterium]|jgi:hypothetical protein
MSAVEYIGDHILTDNELEIFNLMFSILYYSDPAYKATIYKKDDEIIGHITPSRSENKQAIIDNLLFFNRVIKLRVRYSSSLAISKRVSFRIPLEKSKTSVSLQS